MSGPRTVGIAGGIAGCLGLRFGNQDIDGSAGYAALWVCFFHYVIARPAQPGEGLLMTLARQGNAGVYIFFVLSGFIMAHVYFKTFAVDVDRASYGRFLWTRFARIYPLHLLTLLYLVLITWAGVKPVMPNDTPEMFLANLALVHGWGVSNTLSWNLASWTVSVEAFCYLLFPFTLVWVARLSSAALVAVVALCAYGAGADPAGALLSAAGVSATTLGSLQFGLGRQLLPHFLAFAGAVALYVWFARWRDKMTRAQADAAMVLGVAIILGTALGALPWEGLAPVSTWRGFTPYWIGAAFLIVGLYRDDGLGWALFGNPVAVWLGNVSYALYLTHETPLLWSMGKAYLWTMDKAYLWTLGTPYPYGGWHSLPVWMMVGTALALATALHTALALATALHYGFERPARTWLRGMSWQRARSQPAAAAVSRA